MKRSSTPALNLIPIIIFMALFASFLYTLSLTGPTWSPVAPYTNNTLNCSWTNSSDTLAQNITILKNGVLFNWTYENASLMSLNNSRTIDAANTAKGDVFTCRIVLFNATTNTSNEVNVTIINSPPTTEGAEAGIFNGTNATDIGYTFQVYEDVSYSIDVNATDADGDTLEYQPAASFCTLTDSVTGTYTCAPTQSHITNNTPTERNITFSASDGQNVGGRTIRFNITPVNDAPALTLANQTTPVNQSLNYTFTATDEESSFPLTYVLYADAEISNKLSIASLNSNGTSMSIYYNGTNPDFNDVGIWNITINVTDNSSTLGSNDSRSVNYTFTLNITAVGRYPYFTAISANRSNVSGVYNLQQGESIQINVSTNDPDANSTHTFLDNTSIFAIGTLKEDTNASDAIGQINYTAQNAEVGLFDVLVTVRDAESLTNTTVLRFNVTNVNDPPVVNENSTSPSNTQSNVNMSNISAYANTPFVYDVNATDPDTIHGDTLTYSDNTTLFTINSTTGRISLTPTDAQVGSYHINISVIDASGAHANRTLNLTVLANTPPYFNASLTQLNCTTKSNCLRNLGGFADDADPGDSIALYTISFTSGSLGSFNYSNITGMINFTTLKTDVGNYTVNVTITDTHGATNWSLMNISINNTPEAPVLTRYNFSTTIVETHTLTYELQAEDEDLLVATANESITFTTNLSINHTITNLSPTGNMSRATLSFTPSQGDAGNYSIIINATDRFGLSSSRTISIEVLPKVPPPNITNITPWGANNTTQDIQSSWASTSDTQFTDGIASLRTSENTTALFNVTVVDTRPLTYVWKVNGTQVATTQSYSRIFDFFSSGAYNVTVNVSNDRLEYSTFTWIVTVTNVNRAPVLNASLEPIEVNKTYLGTNYFTGASGQRFYDPDDDTDSNGHILSPEANTLTFTTIGSCSVATTTISGSNITVVGTSLGTCNVSFRATDSAGVTLDSNTVTINVTEIIESEADPEPTPSSGGGGGSSSNFIPITRRLETPQAFNLIAPKLVTIYNNNSLQIPITINNTWNGSLGMLRLVAEVNATGVNTSFDQDLFEEIAQGESREVMLTVTNYRMGGNYEVKVVANVSSPQYTDEALILLNSIEQSADGSEYNVKVTFANDLVNQHPECQELNEVLEQAKQHVANGNYQAGTQLVDSVINGCKYLVSMQQKVEERPGRLNPVINIDDLSIKAIMIGVLSFVVLSSIAFLIYYHYSHKPEDDI